MYFFKVLSDNLFTSFLILLGRLSTVSVNQSVKLAKPLPFHSAGNSTPISVNILLKP